MRHDWADGGLPRKAAVTTVLLLCLSGLATAATPTPTPPLDGPPGADTSEITCGTHLPPIDECTRWIETYDGGVLSPNIAPWAFGGRDRAEALDVAPETGLTLVGGWSENEDEHKDPFVAALDTTDGSHVWTWRGDFGDGWDRVEHLVVDEARDQILLGLREDAPHQHAHAWVVSLDLSAGEQQWATQIPPERGSGESIFALDRGPDGDAYAAGELTVGEGFTSGTDAFAARLDANDGTLHWKTVWDGADAWDVFWDLSVPEGGEQAFAGGRTAGLGNGTDGIVAAFDTTDGSLDWTHRVNGTGMGHDSVRTVDVADRIIVSGEETRSGETYRMLTALDPSTGQAEWRSLDEPTGDFPLVVEAELLGDTAFVTGEAGTGAFSLADGSTVWTGGFQGRALSVATSPDAIFLTANQQGTATGFDCHTRSYDASEGELRWEAIYRGPGPEIQDEPAGSRIADRCQDIETEPSTNAALVAGGTWQPGTNTDALAIAYEQNPEGLTRIDVGTGQHPFSPRSIPP